MITLLHNPLSLGALAFDQARPLWLWLLVAAAALLVPAWAYHLIHRRTGRPLALGLLALRLVGVVALLLAMLKPVWTRTQHQTQRPMLAIVVDDSQSMSSPDTSAVAAGQSRYRLAMDWLRQSPQAQALRQRFDLKLFDINGESRDNLADWPAEPAAEQTDLLRPLRQAAASLQGQNAAAVVIVSDGRDTTGRPSAMALEDFTLPVYALGFAAPPASALRAPDAAIVALDAPAVARVHNQVVIRVTLSWGGRRDGAGSLQLEHAGAPLLTDPIRLPAEQRSIAASLTWTPTEPGDFTLTARVLPAGGDRSEANNARTFRVRVEREPLRVMLVEGVLRHEATYLIETLKSDPDLDVITLQRSANPHQAGSGMLGGELFSPQRLEKLNVILLGDFEGRMLDERSYEAIAAWVEKGGGLMVLGGYSNLGPQGLVATPLAKLLPLEIGIGGSVTQIDEPFTFTLTEEGKRHPALGISGDMAQDAAAWSTLPALRGIVAPGAARPGAQVLASHPRGPAVLLTQRFGKGAVAVITADTTWRWSRLARLGGKPDTLYARFWLQMVRWLAHVDVRSDRPPISVSSSAPTYARGQRVDLSVRRIVAAEPTTAGESEPVAALHVRWPDGRLSPLPLSPSALPNQWTASFVPSRGGRFEAIASLRASPDAAPLASHSSDFLVEGSNLELEDPTPSPAALAQIARATGGQFVELADSKAVSELLEEIPAEQRVLERVERAALWNHPLLFLVFLACVSAEWVLRRRHRLV
jgi:hypothetical protein